METGFMQDSLATKIASFFLLLPSVFLLAVGWGQAAPIPFLPKGAAAPETVSYDTAAHDACMQYTEAGGHERHEIVAGESWSYDCAVADGDVAFDQAIDELLARGATLRGVREGEQVGFILPDGANRRLHLSLGRGSDSIRIHALRERFLAAGEKLHVTFTEEERSWCFTTRGDGKRFGYFLVDFDEQAVELAGWQQRRQGQMRRDTSFSMLMTANHGRHWVCARNHQHGGVSNWEIGDRSDPRGGHATVTFVSSDLPMEQVPDGEALGGLLVEGVSWGAVSVTPEYEDRITHPALSDGSYLADRTPTGQALLWLPPGIWRVVVKPEKKVVESLSAHLVPVHPGRVTTLRFPPSLAGAFAAPAAGRLELLRADADGSTGTVDLAIVDGLAEGMLPSTTNTRVFEGGEACKLLDLRPIPQALDVVVLLDSSGSMKGSMSQAVNAVKRFVKSLPEDGRIRVVDFDTKPQLLAAKDRGDLLRLLDGVRARGATCLFDSIMLGLTMLEGSPRPALVVFTDGVDANWNDTKPGSKATKAEVLARAQELPVPIFTIGFGARPDVDSLSRIATLGGGSYYDAGNEAALRKVFDRIGSNLGAQYRLRYERPRAGTVSDAPVVSMVVDNSGSMDMSPEEQGCGYRIERVRQILQQFVLSMPEGFGGQVIPFTGECHVGQVLTQDRAALLRALSLMDGDGATEILGSVRAGIETLRGVPSRRRYLVYVTDAALAVGDAEQAEFDVLLGLLKDAGIQSLWVGIVDGDEEGVFAHAARVSGGEAITSTNLDEVASAIASFSTRIGRRPSAEGELPLRVQMRHRDRLGEVFELAAQDRFRLPPRREGGALRRPQGVSWELGEPLRPYDASIARYLSGTDALLRDVRVQKRIPLAVEGQNRAVAIRADEAFVLSRLRGVEAPSGKRFLALKLTLRNILPRQKVAVHPDGSGHPAAWVGSGAEALRYEERIPDYLIPDLQRHVFLRINNERSLPISEATWLTAAPLSLPDEPGLSVRAGQPVTGTLAFLVPAGNLRQLSLHHFDTNYGHVDLPLVGTMTYQKRAFEKLPTQAARDLTKTFSLRLTAFDDRPEIDGVSAGDGFVFRVVEGTLASRVQAHLDVDPRRRIRYMLPSHRGMLLFPIHPLTERIPLGFYRRSFVTPGATNTIRMAFRVPAVLARAAGKGFLDVDLAGGGLRLALEGEEGSPSSSEGAGAGKTLPGLAAPVLSAQGVRLWVHERGPYRERGLVVEISVSDEVDGSHSSLGELVVLRRKGLEGLPDDVARRARVREEMERAVNGPSGLGSFARGGVDDEGPYGADLLVAEARSETHLFGLDGNSVLPDGITRRGVLYFKIPEDREVGDYVLSSNVDPKLAIELGTGAYENEVMMAARLNAEVYGAGDEGFAIRLAEAVSRLQGQRRRSGEKKPGFVDGAHASFSTEVVGRPVPFPSWSILPPAQEQAMAGLEGLRTAVEGLRFVPSEDTAWAARFSEEAIMGQGWTTQHEIAVAAEARLAARAWVSHRITVEPTEKGREALRARAGGLACDMGELPALRYEVDGIERILVSPFLKDLSELSGLVIHRQGTAESSTAGPSASVSVELTLRGRTEGRNASVVDAGSALAGGEGDEGEETVTVLSVDLPLVELCRGPIDIGYCVVPTMEGRKLHTVADTPAGRRPCEKVIDYDDFTVVDECLYLSTPSGQYRLHRPLAKDEALEDRFHSVAINLPSLTEEAAEALEAERARRHRRASHPDGLSAMKWYGRGSLARFVIAQSRHERHMAETLGVTVARRSKERVIVLHMSKSGKDSPLKASMDLVHVAGELVGAEPEASRAFALVTGLMNARLEGSALPGGKSIFDLWKASPAGTRLLAVHHDNKEAFLEALATFPTAKGMMEALRATDEVILFPSRPASVEGKPRWAWLQLSPHTMGIRSCFDTGEHGAITEHILDSLLSDALSYVVGGWKGVETSVWSMAAFSLELDDFEEIRKAAKAFAGGLADGFGVTGAKVGSVQAGMDVGGNASLSGPLIKFELVPTKGLRPNQNVLGWTNGYKAGVAYYFDRCK